LFDVPFNIRTAERLDKEMIVQTYYENEPNYNPPSLRNFSEQAQNRRREFEE